MPHKKESVKNQRIGESGYVLPEHIPSGEVVHGLKSDEDGTKNQSWRIGKSIGKVNRTICLGYIPVYHLNSPPLPKLRQINCV